MIVSVSRASTIANGSRINLLIHDGTSAGIPMAVDWVLGADADTASGAQQDLSNLRDLIVRRAQSAYALKYGAAAKKIPIEAFQIVGL